MFQNLKKSQTIVYLLIGYTISVILFTVSWVVTTSQINDHVVLIESSERAAKKMNVIASLIEIARSRTRLSHQMIMADDVFEKDEIAQSINALASTFIRKRSELLALNLSEKENAILENQLKLYPVVIGNLETLAELALEDTEQANIKSRNILVKEVVPNQALIIDGFMHLMQIIEEDVHSGSQQLYERHEAHNQSRMFTLLFILILSALVMYVVIKNILKIENRLYELSTSDALTGTLNRRSFDEKIQQEWKRTLRTEEPLSLLFIDIDYFKKYNDHYGHQEGDKCLIRIAGVLKNYSHRAGDSVARYGGEEFAMILPDVDKNGARTVAERLLERVRMENIPHTGSDISQYVTISIGQASLIPTINQSYEELIKASDLALYQSKRSGRNRVTTYTPEKDGKIIELFTSA